MIKRVTDYELIEKIGEGSYGFVFKARNVKNNQLYAIKLIPS